MSRLFPVANVLDTDDWYAPRWIFDGLGIVFDLDVHRPEVRRSHCAMLGFMLGALTPTGSLHP